MGDRPLAACRDLDAMVRAYPPDKRVRVLVPAGELERGAEVDVAAGTSFDGKPSRRAGVAQGRVVRLMAEIEVDLATFESGHNAGQAGFDL